MTHRKVKFLAKLIMIFGLTAILFMAGCTGIRETPIPSAPEKAYCCATFSEMNGEYSYQWSTDSRCGVREGVACAGSCPSVVPDEKCEIASTNPVPDKEYCCQTFSEVKGEYSYQWSTDSRCGVREGVACAGSCPTVVVDEYCK